MGLRLTIHRSAEQIGGNCIEIETETGERILLDFGRPLDATNSEAGLLPKSLNLVRSVSGILISHPHQDHYGLLQEAPSGWPVYSGQAAQKLINLTVTIFDKPMCRIWHSWEHGKPLDIGPFKVTSYLTDHSAFDSYMLLVEAEGKRIFYSGDFRSHGRKGALVQHLMNHPPANLDILLMEGTNLGSNKPTKSESDLEDEFSQLFRMTDGRVFVCWSAQNIDRTVTLYRAALKTGRTLAIDLYTAEVLDLLTDSGKLPRAGWRNIKVVITKGFANLYRRKGRGEFVDRMAPNGISATALAKDHGKWVAMIRPSLIKDFLEKGVVPSRSDAWSFSQWQGYLDQADGVALKTWFDGGGTNATHIHTSGHASVSDLKAFASALKPKALIPIHGEAWDYNCDGFENIVRLYDGMPLNI